jgi:hypothetical protein
VLVVMVGDGYVEKCDVIYFVGEREGGTKVLIEFVGDGYVEKVRRDTRVRILCRREPQFENWV